MPTAFQQYRALVRWNLLEVRRARVLWLVLGVMLGAGLAAGFIGALALGEAAAQRVVIYAGLVRPGLAAVVVLVVVASVVREQADRTVELLLMRPLSRPVWYLARLLSYLLVVVLAAALAALPLCWATPLVNVLFWALALSCELAVLAALALACAVSLAQLPGAVAATAAFYVLARTLSTLLLLAHSSTLDLSQPFNRALVAALTGVAWLVPDFSDFAASGWLIYGLHGASPGWMLAQSALYLALLSVLGLIDWQRRNL